MAKKKKNTRDLAKFCNLLCNLPLLPSPKIGRVNYIILYLAGVLYATLVRRLLRLSTQSLDSGLQAKLAKFTFAVTLVLVIRQAFSSSSA